MNVTHDKAFQLVKKIKALSQTGLTYSTDEYNINRYRELEEISYELQSLLTGTDIDVLANFYLNKKEYPTPKTDIRAVIFNNRNEILLVREKEDNLWSLPGGWADIGMSPKENVINEVAEETGLIAVPVRLLAVMDKKFHPHPRELEYVYKYFIACNIEGGEISKAHDINEVAYFGRDNIPALSEMRVLQSQIELMFEFHFNPGKETVFE
jgi:ADP-ribose pyrophosphatase YjhB (NUDIX family)